MPAVTSVDLCTSEEIGVGAHIASGNHVEKGSCEDLVMPVKQRRSRTGRDTGPDPRQNVRARKILSRLLKISYKLTQISRNLLTPEEMTRVN